MAIQALANRLGAALSSRLPRGLGVEVGSLDPIAPSFAVTVRSEKVEYRFIAGWAGEGWPADVERLLGLAPDVEVVAARTLSVGAREMVEERELGWFDEQGGAHIIHRDGLVVVREVAPRNRQSAIEPGWARSTIAVAEGLLSGTDPRVDSVQLATGLSRGAAAKALTLLEREGYIARTRARGPGSARHITDPSGLLDRYASAVALLDSKSSASVMRFHRLWDDPIEALSGEIAPAIFEALIPWAVTGAAASLLIAPHLSNFSVLEIYVDRLLATDETLFAHLLGARVVDRGHRIEIRPLPSQVTATAGLVIDGVRCAPAVRVYADLRAKGGRSAEAAHHLKEAVIDARAGT